jgi:hypothetical protein
MVFSYEQGTVPIIGQGGRIGNNESELSAMARCD